MTYIGPYLRITEQVTSKIDDVCSGHDHPPSVFCPQTGRRSTPYKVYTCASDPFWVWGSTKALGRLSCVLRERNSEQQVMCVILGADMFGLHVSNDDGEDLELPLPDVAASIAVFKASLVAEIAALLEVGCNVEVLFGVLHKLD